jgi:GMP synthase-like glutamine amidotransferase
VDVQSLPDGFINIGHSELCGLQGIYKRGRVLTFQGHAEFDEEIVLEFGKPFLGREKMIAELGRE